MNETNKANVADTIAAERSRTAPAKVLDLASLAVEPCVVDIPSIGTVVFRRWNVGAIQIASDLLEREFNDRDFAVHFLTGIGRCTPPGMPADDGVSDKGTPLKLIEIGALPAVDLNALAEKYLDIEGVALRDCIRGFRPPNRQNRELILEFSGGSPIEQLHDAIRKAVTSFEEGLSKTALGLTSGLSGFFGKGGKGAVWANTNTSIAEALAGVRRASIGIDSRLADIISGRTRASENFASVAGLGRSRGHAPEIEKTLGSIAPRIEFPPNPILETNRRLDQVAQTMTDLVEISASQGKLIQSLVDISQTSLSQSSAAVGEAKESSASAKRGVWLAVVSIFVAIGAMVITHFDGNKTDAELHTLAQSAASATAIEQDIAISLAEQRRDREIELRKMLDALEDIQRRDAQVGEQKLAIERDISEKLQALIHDHEPPTPEH